MNATSATLLPAKGQLHLEQITATGDRIVIVASAIRPYACCPCCAQPTNHIHSRYKRTVTDLPWQGVALQFHLNVRKFFCDNGNCERRIFTEPLPGVVNRYGRKTVRLTDALRELVLLIGGEVAARVAERFGLLVSPATLLRHLFKTTTAPMKVPRVLGIDDFAFKKGHRYGTVLVDLEKRCPVDLLPDRDAKTVEKWLKANPGVQIVSRDRAEVYRNGVTAGAPNAIQVADRWHLLKNLGDALKKTITRKHRLLREAMKPENKREENEEKPTCMKQHRPEPMQENPSPPQERRRERYEEVVSLWQQGLNISAISRTTGCDRKTIRGWLSGNDLLPRSPRPERPGKIAPFGKYLSQRFAEGCRNGAQLLDEIKVQGFTGGYTTLSTYLSRMRKDDPQGANKRASRRIPSSRRLSWTMTNRGSPKVTGEERALLDRLCESCPEMKAVAELGTAFCEMVRQRQGERLSSWLASAHESGIAEMRSFATGLSGDLAAVTAALTSDWSNGQTEGQVNRLKFLKRQMYGRAGFDLLRARVLYRATA